MTPWRQIIAAALLAITIILGITAMIAIGPDCDTHWVAPTYIGGIKTAGCGPVVKGDRQFSP